MKYPDLPRPASPYPFRFNQPVISGGPEWALQSRALTRYDLFECDLNYRGKSWAEIQVIAAFFRAVSGSAGRFTFVDFNGVGTIGGTDPGVPWQDLYVTQGDGAAAGPWDLPTYAIKESTATVSGSVATGSHTVTPSSMAGIVLGCALTAKNADGTNGEVLTVTALTGTTFTATFASAKASNWLLGAPVVFLNGVAQTTNVVTGLPGSDYSIKVGLGTDGVDALYAGAAPADGVIVTIAATCRRALRRAKFVSPKHGFVYNVPENYLGDGVTIAEVLR